MVSDNILIGVVSGIIATAIFSVAVFIGSVIWRKLLEPWWENRLYKDARIDGEWYTKLSTNETDSDLEMVNVKQTGHSICGDITCTEGPDKGSQYKFVGCIRNQILNAYYWNQSKTSTDSGSFSLRLENNGNELRGYTAYYHDGTHALLAREYTWTRRCEWGSS